jgi:hypothetical protein
MKSPRRSSLNINSRRKQPKTGASTLEQSKACTDATCRIIFKLTAREETQQTRLSPNQISTRTLETRHKTNTIHVGCQQFWSQVCRWRTCATSQDHPWRTLQAHMQLDRHTIHRDHIGLGIQATASTPLYAKLCQEGIDTVSTHHQQIAARTIPKCTHTIWSQETICNTKIISTVGWRQNQEVYPAIMRQVPIPGPRSGQHTTMPNQCHCITISRTNYRYIEIYTPTTPLLSVLGACEPMILPSWSTPPTKHY